MKLFKFLIVFLALIFQTCLSQPEKINGVSFVASRESIDHAHVKPVVNVNANYAAIMPFGFIRNLEHPEIVFNTQRQWFGETTAGAKQYVEVLQQMHIKIMIKPQIWIWHGEFTGYLEMASEADWKTLENSYSKFILEYAQLAHEVNAELFCIGTELEKFIENRPDYWRNLIAEIKKTYKGKLTYAANWDEFKRTPFWDELDFIGIDAYFPVSDSKTPTVAEATAGWKTHKPVIEQVSNTFNKPILFTEFGYRSVDYSGKEPWKSDRNMGHVNLDAQTNTTKALLETFWNEDWFAGGFIWKWFVNHEAVGGVNNAQFTPQNKPVEAVLRKHYSDFK
ncbi:glycoside hydrolase family 113 [Hwangdonia seohaensis]|uniref:Glycoside hydrolase TIM-barrel-like domain-containing protein n=1 Tax=Hwangdonia seohaensis TaxID=1240727 RepID=A0ABW3R760_9FLAO|nr:glycoside hydrolase TIM-barrel-like domain-containing protein [Hwangdonia seohaensis]